MSGFSRNCRLVDTLLIQNSCTKFNENRTVGLVTERWMWSPLKWSISYFVEIDLSKMFGESVVMCWRRMEKFSLTGHVKEQRNILHEICKRKAYWFGHILRRNCLQKQVIEHRGIPNRRGGFWVFNPPPPEIPKF
jgi:hypothetical protein